MIKKKLIIKTSSLEESLTRFRDTWKEAEKCGQTDSPVEILSFENTSMLMKILSPRRLELLQALHKLGAVSIRYLAKQVNRDYSNVYSDVKALTQAGIIENEEAKYFVPWDIIVTEFELGSKKLATQRHQRFSKVAGHK